MKKYFFVLVFTLTLVVFSACAFSNNLQAAAKTTKTTVKEKPLQNSIMAYWRAEENSADLTDYHNDGKLNNITFTDGKFGEAFSLNGDNSYLDIPENKVLNLQDQFAFSLWIKTSEDRLNEKTKQREILTRRGSNISFGYEYETTENKTWLRCYVQFEDGTSKEVELKDMASYQTTRDNAWHHLLVSFKRNDLFKLYIDGKLVDSETAPDKNVKLSGTNNGYILGGRLKTDGVTLDRTLKADLDEIMVFNRSLSDEEVGKIYSKNLNN